MDSLGRSDGGHPSVFEEHPSACPWETIGALTIRRPRSPPLTPRLLLGSPSPPFIAQVQKE